MSKSKSPEDGAGDFHFSSDDDIRRPRRAAPQRNAFVEEGTDSDSDASGPANRRKTKRTKSKKAPPAKKQKLGGESDSDDDKDSKMQHLTEKERELEIFRHIEQQELMKTRKQIQQKLLGADGSEDEKPEKSKKDATEKESGEESSSSSEDEAKKERSEESEIDMDTEFHRPSDVAKKIEKKQAIAELVRSRKEKRLQEEKRKETLDVDKVFGASSDSDESSSSDSSGSDSDSDDDRRRSSPDAVKGEPISNAEHLNMMKMSRFRLAKICHAPFFEKTVVGCFVRVGVGIANGEQVYRAAQVIGVVRTAKQYNVENVRTDKGLKLKHGPDERVYRLEFLSNQKISDKEYYKWKDSMERARLPLPTTEFAEKKQSDIQSAINYIFTDDDIKQMVNENLKFKTVRTNIALQKAELLKQKLDAEQRGDISLALKCQNEIDQIDTEITRKEDEVNREAKAITLINQRNRELQRQTLSQVKIDDTNKEDDPFTRKSQRMKPVAGKSRNVTDLIEKKDAGKNPISNLKQTLTHSSSTPILSSLNPSLLLDVIPDESPRNSPIPTFTNGSTTNKSGSLSLAEWKKRKAEAAAAAGK